MVGFILKFIGYTILLAISLVPAGVVHFFLKNDIPAKVKESVTFNLPYLGYQVVYAHLNMSALGHIYLMAMAYVVIIWVAISWIRARRSAI